MFDNLSERLERSFKILNNNRVQKYKKLMNLISFYSAILLFSNK